MLEANAIEVRIGELCHQFRLPTMGAQSVSRFTATGHGDALETLLEVLEQEAEDRRQRRIGRLRTASRLPAGKTHALCALGHRLVEAGRSVLFGPAYRLVQDLLAAKRDLEVWPESHWPGFALRQADVFQPHTA